MVLSDKPLLQVLSGQKAERIPVWLMRQAGRYLPEYRELRESKGGFLDMALDPKAACEITMQPIRRFGMDGAIIFSDILVVPMALGQTLDFVAGEGPKLGAIEQPEDINSLSFLNFGKVLKPVYEVISLTRDSLLAEGFHQTALIGFAGAPWTVATYMIEGGSSKDFMKVKRFAFQQPEAFSNLMETLIEATVAYLIQQVHAGAEVLQLFDSWAGVVDADHFKQFVLKPAQRIVSAVKEECPDTPIIGFPKGSGILYRDYAYETGINAIGIDHTVPSDWAVRTLQSGMPVQGNLDPAVLLSGGDALVLGVERVLDELGKGSFIFNLGHGVHKETPPEHVEKLIEMVRSHAV